jgi:uncharacterized Zn finger protein (UPF0148 family)
MKSCPKCGSTLITRHIGYITCNVCACVTVTHQSPEDDAIILIHATNVRINELILRVVTIEEEMTKTKEILAKIVAYLEAHT